MARKKVEEQKVAPETETAPVKGKTVYEKVMMDDGREVEFPGTRKVSKRFEVNEGTGEVTAFFDYRNGKTLSYTPTGTTLLQLAGHGALQKIGDESASLTDVEDIVISHENMIKRLQDGEGFTRVAREVTAGANLAIKALMEVYGKTAAEIKVYLQSKVDAAKANGQKITLESLYLACRNPSTRVGQVYARLEQEKTAASTVNADEAFADLG